MQSQQVELCHANRPQVAESQQLGCHLTGARTRQASSGTLWLHSTQVSAPSDNMGWRSVINPKSIVQICSQGQARDDDGHLGWQVVQPQPLCCDINMAHLQVPNLGQCQHFCMHSALACF